MDPVTAAIIAQGVQAGYQAVKGAQQKRQAKRLKPSTYIPPALQSQLAADKNRTAKSITKRQQLADKRINRMTAQTSNRIAKTGGSAGNMIIGAAAADAQGKDAIQESEVIAESERERNRDKLSATKMSVARVQQKNQDEYEAAKSALLGAGDQNIFGGIKTAGSTAAFAAGAMSGDKPKGTIGDDGMYTPGGKTSAGVDLTPGFKAERDTPIPGNMLVTPGMMENETELDLNARKRKYLIDPNMAENQTEMTLPDFKKSFNPYRNLIRG